MRNPLSVLFAVFSSVLVQVPARRRAFARCAVAAEVETLESRVLLSITSNSAETQVFRVLNPNLAMHTFTTSEGERDTLVNTYGYVDETQSPNVGGFGVFTGQLDGSSPVRRLYNPNNGEHYYTIKDVERDFLVTAGWSYEKDEGAIFATPHPGVSAIYRLYNERFGGHLFTENRAMADAVLVQFPGIWVEHSVFGYGIAFPNADLEATVTSVTAASVGDTIRVDMRAGNRGLSDVPNAQMVLSVPAGMQFAGSSSSGVSVSGGNVVWNIGAFNANDSRAAQATFTVTDGSSPKVFTGTLSSSTPDVFAQNNVSSAAVNINPVTIQPNVAISLTGPATADTGTNVSYTVTLTNTTSVIVQNAIATISDIAGLTYQSSSTNQATHSNGVTTFTPGFIAVGGSATATLTYQVSAAAGSSVTLNSSVTMPNDAIASDNNASRTLSVNNNPPPSGADVSVVVSTQAVAAPGSTGSLVITVTNAGPLLSTGDRLTMTVPAGVSFVSADQSDITYNGTNVVWDMVFVGINEVLTRVVNVHWDTIGTRSIVTTVTATTLDPNLNNNTVTKTIVVG